MALIEWKDEYSVNVEIIDEQHKHFVSILNKLYENVQSKNTEALPEILTELVKYKEYHFDTEEKYFKEFGYSEAKEHIAEHDKLKAEVNKFLERKDDPLIVCFDLLDFLENWLVHHLSELDKKYTKCFNEHGLV